jgi:hypothetical protein
MIDSMTKKLKEDYEGNFEKHMEALKNPSKLIRFRAK